MCHFSSVSTHEQLSKILSLFEIFLILLWMCRNNSHASKYCQDLQNSYISVVLSVSWARDFGIFLYCLRSLSRTGSSGQCCSKFLCHSFHIRVSPTTLCMCKLSSTQAGEKKPSPVQFYVVFSKIFSKGKRKKIWFWAIHIPYQLIFLKITSLKQHHCQLSAKPP